MFKNKTIRNLLIYDFIYQTIYLILFIPFLKEIFKIFLKYFSVGYFTADFFKEIFPSPTKIFLLTIIVIIISIFNIIEHTSFVFTFNQIRIKNNLSITQIFNNTYKTLKKKSKIKNMPILLFALTGIPFSNSISKYVKVPEYITIHFMKHKNISLYILLIIITISAISIFTMYIYHIFFIEDLNFKESLIKCIKLSKNNIKRNTFCIFKIILKRICISILKISALYFMLLMFYFQFDRKMSNLAIFMYLTMASIIKTALNVSINYITFNDISKLYFKTQDEKIFSNEKYIENNKIGLKLAVLVLVLTLTAFFNKYRYTLEEIESYHSFVNINPSITAHRGSTKNAMENTIEAVEEAIELGADYAEIDVMLTKDNVVVLCHDHNLKRLTGKNLLVKNLNWSELKEIKIKDKKRNKEYSFCTLKKAIEKSNGKIKLNIELKPNGNEKQLAKEVTKLIDGEQKNLIISSLSSSVLKEIKNIDNSIRCGFIVAFAYGDFTSNMEFVDFYVIEQDQAKIRLIKKLHRMDKDVIVWTTNSKYKIEKAIRNGADGIITDEIALAKQTIQKTTELNENATYEFILKKVIKIIE